MKQTVQDISKEENLTNEQIPKKNEEPLKEQILEKKRDSDALTPEGASATIISLSRRRAVGIFGFCCLM